MAEEKVRSLEEAIGLVADGDLVALQNMATQMAPMAAVRELIRQGRRHLGIVCLVGGMPVDWLAAAGVIDRLIGAAVSMEQFGLCQRYRRAVEAGDIRMHELSETALLARLGAGARNLPFLPTRGLIGTDLIDLSEDLVQIEDPFGGPPVIACRALVPDVALIHAHRADRFGNVQFDPTIIWPDSAIFPTASTRVIVTVEEIIDSDVLRRTPERTRLPGFLVDAVVEVPYGAHPTSFDPAYGYDSAMHLAWGRASRDDDATAAFLKAHVHDPVDQAAYLDAAGGPEMLARVGRWEHE